MVLDGQINLPTSCGSVQDLTNPDFCGIGVLGSYTAGVALVFLHQAVFAILDCISSPRTTLANNEVDPHNPHHSSPAPTKRFQLLPSISASSITLFDNAIVLAISWQIAALLSLKSSSSVQTTHDVLLVSLTAYASIAIYLGALCTSIAHIRRHKYRLLSAVVACTFCAAVTALAQPAISIDDFSKEACLPFFTSYKPNMRRYFAVLSVTFWLISLTMLAMLSLSVLPTTQLRKSHPNVLHTLQTSRLYVTVILELVLLIIIVLVNHYFVPEQVLREQAGGHLAESQWTFGQIVGMLIWAPVVVEFGYVFICGSKEGLEGRLPVGFYVTRVQAGAGVGSSIQLPPTKRGLRVRRVLIRSFGWEIRKDALVGD